MNLKKGISDFNRMRVKIAIMLLILSVFVAHSQTNSQVEPVLESLSVFPGIRDFTMTTNNKEGYITILSPMEEISVLVRIELVNNIWNNPTILPFSGKYNDLEPFLSKDDLRLYFVSNRPMNDQISETKDYDIWYVERKDVTSAWGDPVNIGAPINTEGDEFYPSVSENGNMYFTSNNPNSKGKDDIFYSIWTEKGYDQPLCLNDAINTDGYEFNAYIAPDESYIIFSGYNRSDGQGSGDLYISYRNDSLQWSKAHNLGLDINSKNMDYCPFVDHGSNHLYFTSKRSDFNKVNDFKSIEELQHMVNKQANGQSKIYRVSLDALKLPK